MATPELEACAVAHGGATDAAVEQRTLVAVFASPVAEHLLRYGRDLGYRPVLLEPDPARAVDLPGHQPRLDSNRIRLYRHQRCLRASARPSRDGPPRHEAGGPLSCSSAGFSRSRHSDEADHYSRQHRKDQTVIGNRTDAHRPDHRR